MDSILFKLAEFADEEFSNLESGDHLFSKFNSTLEIELITSVTEQNNQLLRIEYLVLCARIFIEPLRFNSAKCH